MQINPRLIPASQETISLLWYVLLHLFKVINNFSNIIYRPAKTVVSKRQDVMNHAQNAGYAKL